MKVNMMKIAVGMFIVNAALVTGIAYSIVKGVL